MLSDAPFEVTPIFEKINYLFSYVLDGRLKVDRTDFDLDDYYAYLNSLNPHDKATTRQYDPPNKLKDAVWAVYKFWLTAERFLSHGGLHRTICVRAFSVFAATAFQRFRVDFGHWGEFLADFENIEFFLPSSANYGNGDFEAIFTHIDIGLLLGIRVQGGKLGRQLKEFATNHGFRYLKKGDLDKHEQSVDRMFSETYTALEYKDKTTNLYMDKKPEVPDGREARNISCEYWKYEFIESIEYFQAYVNKNEKPSNLEHGATVIFLRECKNYGYYYKFTDFQY